MVRLDKYLADAGYGTRSEVKELVKKGRVSVAGKVVKDSGMKVEAGDTICVAGMSAPVPLGQTKGNRWYMLNKPAGVLSATEDANDETVIDLMKGENVKGLFPVGRLDKDTEGLLLISDDGELGHYLLSPKRGITKKYYAKVCGILKPEHVRILENGVEFKDFTSKPAVLEILSVDEQSGVSEAIVTVTEGKFHEVKRLIAAVGGEVTYLKRIEFAGLKLDEGLKAGEYRMLEESELADLKRAANGNNL